MEGKGDRRAVDEMNINPFCSRISERRGRRSLRTYPSSRRFVRLKIILTAALRQGVLKTSVPSFGVHVRPPYRALGFVQLNSAFCILNSALTCQRQVFPALQVSWVCIIQTGFYGATRASLPTESRIVQLKNKPV